MTINVASTGTLTIPLGGSESEAVAVTAPFISLSVPVLDAGAFSIEVSENGVDWQGLMLGEQPLAGSWATSAAFAGATLICAVPLIGAGFVRVKSAAAQLAARSIGYKFVAVR